MREAAPLPVIKVASVEDAADVSRCAPWTLVDLDGKSVPEAHTSVRFAATRLAFLVRAESAAEPPLAISHVDGGDVYRDECVEVFLASPEDVFVYDEFVVNPMGALYAAHVENRAESRETWRVTRRPPGVPVEIRVEGHPDHLAPSAWTTWTCLLSVPWNALSNGRPPVSGEERRGNVTRIARGRSTHYFALSPTFRAAPADFHVPSRFARFVF